MGVKEEVGGQRSSKSIHQEKLPKEVGECPSLETLKRCRDPMLRDSVQHQAWKS